MKFYISVFFEGVPREFKFNIWQEFPLLYMKIKVHF